MEENNTPNSILRAPYQEHYRKQAESLYPYKSQNTRCLPKDNLESRVSTQSEKYKLTFLPQANWRKNTLPQLSICSLRYRDISFHCIYRPQMQQTSVEAYFQMQLMAGGDGKKGSTDLTAISNALCSSVFLSHWCSILRINTRYCRQTIFL